MNKACAIILLSAASFLAVPAVQGGMADDPRGWLEQMSAAMSQMSYQGTFVYVHGDQLETMRITHVSDADGIRERLVSLSGPEREILRDGEGVRWVLGDESEVLADSAFNRSVFPQLPPDLVSQAGKSYSFAFGDESRIAGHQAKNVKVLPRDHYRYGYSLWLEKHSGLLLKWELIDSKRRSLARFMFTDLRLGAEVDLDELKPSGSLQGRKTVKSGLPDADSGQADSPRWAPSRLPPGFTLVNHRYIDGGGKADYEHLVYSDGLAAVSVYVESLHGGGGHPEATQQHGTTFAYTGTRENVMVTVVGNVPAAAVEMIGKSVASVED